MRSLKIRHLRILILSIKIIYIYISDHIKELIQFEIRNNGNNIKREQKRKAILNWLPMKLLYLQE